MLGDYRNVLRQQQGRKRPAQSVRFRSRPGNPLTHLPVYPARPLGALKPSVTGWGSGGEKCRHTTTQPQNPVAPHARREVRTAAESMHYDVSRKWMCYIAEIYEKVVDDLEA